VSRQRLGRSHSDCAPISLLAALASILVVAPSGAQTCPNTPPACDRSGCGYAACATPAFPVPQAIWNLAELQPATPACGLLPGDSTKFQDSVDFGPDTNFYLSLDTQNGFVFNGLGYGMQVWDARTNPASPTLLGTLKHDQFPYFRVGGELYDPIQSISVPAGVDNMAALSARAGGIGVVIVNLNDKGHPSVAYQGEIAGAPKVYAVKIGGTNYAFAATQQPSGVYLFNMDKALLGNGCLETLATPGQCPGVALGPVIQSEARFVAGVDTFLAVTGGVGTGFSIYDVSNPLSPQLKLSGLNTPGTFTSGVAMWKDAAGRYYLATRAENSGNSSDTFYIFDVSCISGASCPGSGTMLYSRVFQEDSQGDYYVTASSSNGTPFIYLGSDNPCPQGQQAEYLFDVSNPSAPRDITPPSVGGVGYWGWYYRSNPTGFNGVVPLVGKFSGAYFYRAAGEVFDIHHWVGVTQPTAAFTWNPQPPAPVYPGATVSFTNTSAGGQLTCSWTFQDGSPAMSTDCNPSVTFPAHTSYPFNESVTLKVTNGSGNSTVTQAVTLTNPAPQISSISVSPANPLQCQTVTLTANATGQATLAYSWNLVNSSGQGAMGGMSAANPFAWNSAMAAADTYTAGVIVSNNAPPSASFQQKFTLAPLPALAGSGTFAPTNAAFPAGTVQFNVVAAGATAWNWNFGDNPGGGPNHDGYVGWVTDPIAGPAPSHTYMAIGLYTVTVQVRNCVNLGPATSAPLSVTIIQTTPLVAGFVIGCTNSLCSFPTGTTVSFTDTSTGPPTAWDYDWDGSGAFADSGHAAPVTSHTYNTTGHFTPGLRVHRGSEPPNTFVYSSGIAIVPASPPAISVSGGSQGVIGTAYTFNASATNCTPAANGWSWTTGGGAGSSTSFSISITWATAGPYQVTATNSACTGASGSASITISNSNGGPSISVSGGGQGVIGTAYTFNAFASNCTPAPSGWSWTTGGGAGSSTTSSISVTWATAGPYVVTATNSACSGASGSANITIGKSGGGTLHAAFSYSPSAPTAGSGVSFDGSASTGATGYTWFFGDPNNTATGSGAQASHVYSQAGTYTVKLDVSAPGSSCAQGVCINEAVQTVMVLQGTLPTLSGAFISPACDAKTNACTAVAGVPVTLSAVDARGTTYAWIFGDGTTGSGATVTHTWSAAQSFTVSLAVSATGYTGGTSSQLMVITTPPPPTNQSVVLPWVAATRGALVQSCDLYLHNPGANPVPVTLQFRKRGTPDVNPPQATAVIQPGATMYAPDVVQSVFSRDNIAGFVTVTVKSTDPLPVMTSFNTVTRTDGSQFGQTVPGLALPIGSTSRSSTPGSTFQYLAGLNDNSDQLAYFGISNPTATTTTYHVRLFDTQGNQIGESKGDLTLGPFAQRQFQQADVHSLFGLTTATDYLVSIENKSGSTIFPYGENVRMGSGDPSFVTVGNTSAATQYVIGAFSTNGSWQTDLVLANTSTQPMSLGLTFIRTGVTATTTAPVTLTLNPGDTQRLSNAIAGKWNLSNVVGVITVTSAGANGLYPIVQAESYNNAQPANRYGQSMAAFSDANQAKVGQSHYLVGLRQDANHLSTIWVFNNSTTDYGIYDVVYRGLDGTVLGTVSNLTLPPGRVRGFLPNQLPVPAGGVTNGFTVQVVVKHGTVLTAAQVLSLSTGDPAYVQGAAR
jgi:PKD repeat protein